MLMFGTVALRPAGQRRRRRRSKAQRAGRARGLKPQAVSMQRLAGATVLRMMTFAETGLPQGPTASPAGAQAPPAPEPRLPYPPRFRWLRRLSVLCALVAAGLVGLRVWWGWEAQRRLQRALDPIVAAGDPVDGPQMNAAAIPPEHNAAAYLKAASAAIVFPDTPASTSYSFTVPPYGNQWDSLAEQSVKKNARVFPLVRRARDFAEADWGTRMKRPIIATLLPHLNDVRQLANVLGDAALYAHFRGDDAAALETVRDVRHEARVVGREPFVVCHLVGVGIEMLAQARLQVIASRLRVAPGDVRPRPADVAAPAGSATGPFPSAARAQLPRPASGAQVRTLIAELLDDRDVAEALRRAFAGERASQLDMADWFGESSHALRPMFQLDALRMLEQDGVLLEAAVQPNWPAAGAVLARGAARKPVPAPAAAGAAWFGARPVPPKRVPIDYARVLSSNLVGGTGTGRAIQLHMRMRSERRMSAVSLAAQLYRTDHGDWPPSLEALVPQYLPQVPRDAVAAGDAPLRYLLVKGGLPDGSDRPLVYSVGVNGVDDTVGGAALPAAPCYEWQNNRDEWRDLTRWTPFVATMRPTTQRASAPTSAPSPQAGDDESNEADDPRED
jgi:hypothetical protein